MSDRLSILCRRCGQAYHHEGGLLRACPACGASPVALRDHLRHNGLAAVLSVIALIVLVLGMVLPFISMTKLGTSRVYSLIGGIGELFHSGNTFIAAILLVFSVIFPFAKLLMLLAATSGLVAFSPTGRRVMHKIAVVTGKYSLLDLLVVAVMIVLVKFDQLADVQARPGTILFGVAVLLSIAAGFCVNLDERDDQTMSEPIAPSPPRRSRVYLKLLWLLLGLGILAPGVWRYYNVPPGGDVDAIKLTTKSGVVGQAAEAVDNVDLSTPDLYLKLFTPAGESRLPTFKDTPVGNGLTWNLPKAHPLAELQRLEVWDHRAILSDKQVDRITFDGITWNVDGQRFHIDLLGRRNAPPTWALPVMAVGATISLLALLRFVWDQVI